MEKKEKKPDIKTGIFILFTVAAMTFTWWGKRNPDYVKVNIEYVCDWVGFDEEITFTGKDNEYSGAVWFEESDEDIYIELPLGSYRVFSQQVEERMGLLCDVQLVKPGGEITLVIDIENETVKEKQGKKEKVLTFSRPAAHKLDRKMLDTETTDIDDRAEYYDTHVTHVMNYMDEDEKADYRVKINMKYVGAEEYKGDYISFLRNDNVISGFVYTLEVEDTELRPGIYQAISSELDEEHCNFGEFEILTPGEEITLEIDYTTHTVRKIENN